MVRSLLRPFLIIALSVFAVSANADSLDDLVGTWHGALDVRGQQLPLVVHVKKEGDAYAVAMDSPAQGATGIPGAEPALVDGIFSFTVPAIAGSFSGDVSPDGDKIIGEWSQGGASLPLVLKRGSGKAAEEKRGVLNRPQTPVPPFPYIVETVDFPSADKDISLAGTITRPEGNGPFPGVVLITGSGPQDRDETIMGHKPFWVIADYLTRNGYAVLRYDDRGIGASEGDFQSATTYHFAKDAAGAIDVLRNRGDISSAGYFGHSEGGVAAILAHDQHMKADFLVLMTTPVLPYSEYIIDQVRALNIAAGASPAQADANAAAQQKIIDAALTGATPEETSAAVENTLVSIGLDQETAAQQAAPFGTPWLYTLLDLDPRPQLAEVRVPVLGLWADRDVQVDAAKNRDAAAVALSANDKKQLMILPNLNHLLQPATTGSVEEYNEIETTIAGEALQEITAWLNETTAGN